MSTDILANVRISTTAWVVLNLSMDLPLTATENMKTGHLVVEGVTKNGIVVVVSIPPESWRYATQTNKVLA